MYQKVLCLIKEGEIGVWLIGVFLKMVGSYEKVNFPVSFGPNFIHSDTLRNEIEIFKKICSSALSV
jgi:hypothetical protein